MHMISGIFISQGTKRATFPATVEMACESKGLGPRVVSFGPGPHRDPSEAQEAHFLSCLLASNEGPKGFAAPGEKRKTWQMKRLDSMHNERGNQANRSTSIN